MPVWRDFRAMGKLATVGLAAAVFGPMMNISGSALATWWHRKTPMYRQPIQLIENC